MIARTELAGRIGWWPASRYHWRCGIDSHIPRCCILWFVTAWHLFYQQLWSWDYDSLSDAFYIRCPLCAVRNRVQIISIDTWCDHYSDFVYLARWGIWHPRTVSRVEPYPPPALGETA